MIPRQKFHPTPEVIPRAQYLPPQRCAGGAPWATLDDYLDLLGCGDRCVTLLEATAADRAWIATQMQHTFATQQAAEAVRREIRSRQRQIEGRQAKLADLRLTFQPWR